MSGFPYLPTELQLQVLDKVPSRDLLNLLCINKFFNNLALSTIESKIGNLVFNQDFFISLYSPQLHHHLGETFNTICLSNPTSLVNTPKYPTTNESLIDMNQLCTKLNELENKPHALLFQSLSKSSQLISGTCLKTLFRLGTLMSTYNPLDLKNSESGTISDQCDQNNLLLLVHEDEPYIKFHLELKVKCKDTFTSIYKFNTRLDPNSNSGTINSDDNILSLNYKLTKGAEVPPRSPYDYDVLHYYNLEVGNVQINSLYLLHQIDF
ncbi:hypothetical protein CANINC_004529 [Pichia inconspicua]|uniref:F-box domain-containing protein n=1 Tax=Pichia inconspicua TaxID=52247 RepID=A0A4T0WWQ0_9ASCO|nr:hypothetical protein CANINC_004529 [[Candida] inconspicua]